MTGPDAFVEASASAIIWFVADRWTKSLVTRRLGNRVIVLGPVIRLREVTSTRMPSPARSSALLGVLWCIAVVCAIVLRSRLGWFASRGAVLGLGAAFGGAAGNLVDVLRRRPIIDFVDLSWWPVFNVADIAIVAGLLSAFLIHG